MINFTPKTGSETTTTPLSPKQGISPSTTSDNNAPQAKAEHHLSTLENLLKQLPEGKTLEAQVKSSQLLSYTEKSLLERSNPSLVERLNQHLAKAQESSNKLLPGSASPTTKATIHHNALFLAKLSVNQSNGQTQIITTVTPQALKINESILIGQRNQQLLIDRSPTQKVQQAATETIKQILPKQQSTHALQQFIQQLSQLPKALQTQLLTKATLGAMQSLSAFTHSDTTLQNGPAVKQAITNSGIQLEAKVQSYQQLSNDLRAVLSKITASIAGKQTHAALNYSANHNSEANSDTQVSFTPKEIEKLANFLLNTLPNTTANSLPSQQALLGQTATAALLRLLGVPLPPDNPGLQALPKMIEQHLKQLIEKTQARIQLNQLRTLNLDKTFGDNRSGALQQFHTELPLRFNEQVLPVQITIQEQEYKKQESTEEEGANNSNEKTKTEKHWQIFMSFDLPDNETLHTRVNVFNSTVSATLWAESDHLCNKAKQKISFLRDKLLANGLAVEDLVCIHGKPPQQNFSLDYNLVDIKT